MRLLSDLNSILQKPITIEKNSSVYHAISELLKKNISRLIVTDKNSPVGIVTEKDIGLFLLNDDTEKNLDDVSISSIMNNLTSVHDSMSVEDCAEMMLEKKIGSLGVVSNNNGLIGLITKTDLASYYINNCEGRHSVGDVMTISYLSMNSEDYLKDIVSKMIGEKISRLFLKNNNNELEGIITFRDLFNVSLEQGNSDTVLDNSDPAISILFTRKGFLSDSGFGKTIQAKDVMSKDIVAVDFKDDLVVACKAMIENKINGVGVNINGKLGGVVSKTDTLKAIYIDK